MSYPSCNFYWSQKQASRLLFFILPKGIGVCLKKIIQLHMNIMKFGRKMPEKKNSYFDSKSKSVVEIHQKMKFMYLSLTHI